MKVLRAALVAVLAAEPTAAFVIPTNSRGRAISNKIQSADTVLRSTLSGRGMGLPGLQQGYPRGREEDIEEIYFDWCRKYNREPDEGRFEMFRQNYFKIQELARQTDQRIVLNEFADSTEEEYNMHQAFLRECQDYGVQPNEQRWEEFVDNYSRGGREASLPSFANLTPDEYRGMRGRFDRGPEGYPSRGSPVDPFWTTRDVERLDGGPYNDYSGYPSGRYPPRNREWQLQKSGPSFGTGNGKYGLNEFRFSDEMTLTPGFNDYMDGPNFRGRQDPVYQESEIRKLPRSGETDSGWPRLNNSDWRSRQDGSRSGETKPLQSDNWNFSEEMKTTPGYDKDRTRPLRQESNVGSSIYVENGQAVWKNKDALEEQRRSTFEQDRMEAGRNEIRWDVDDYNPSNYNRDDDEKVQTIYEIWCRSYKKEASQERFRIFAENYRQVEHHNRRTGERMQMNQYADLTGEEYQRLRGPRYNTPGSPMSGDRPRPKLLFNEALDQPRYRYNNAPGGNTPKSPYERNRFAAQQARKFAESERRAEESQRRIAMNADISRFIEEEMREMGGDTGGPSGGRFRGASPDRIRGMYLEWCRFSGNNDNPEMFRIFSDIYRQVERDNVEQRMAPGMSPPRGNISSGPEPFWTPNEADKAKRRFEEGLRRDGPESVPPSDRMQFEDERRMEGPSSFQAPEDEYYRRPPVPTVAGEDRGSVRGVYERWCRSFGKQSSEERFQIFSRNYEKVQEMNRRKGSDIQMNEFSDMTEDEFKRTQERKFGASSVRQRNLGGPHLLFNEPMDTPRYSYDDATPRRRSRATTGNQSDRFSAMDRHEPNWTTTSTGGEKQRATAEQARRVSGRRYTAMQDGSVNPNGGGYVDRLRSAGSKVSPDGRGRSSASSPSMNKQEPLWTTSGEEEEKGRRSSEQARKVAENQRFDAQASGPPRSSQNAVGTPTPPSQSSGTSNPFGNQMFTQDDSSSFGVSPPNQSSGDSNPFGNQMFAQGESSSFGAPSSSQNAESMSSFGSPSVNQRSGSFGSQDSSSASPPKSREERLAALEAETKRKAEEERMKKEGQSGQQSSNSSYEDSLAAAFLNMGKNQVDP